MSSSASRDRSRGASSVCAAWMRRLLPAAFLPACLAASVASVAAAAPQQDSTRVVPQTPGLYREEGLTAPPLPGYAIMGVLGVAVIGLSLWSSKRTQLD